MLQRGMVCAASDPINAHPQPREQRANETRGPRNSGFGQIVRRTAEPRSGKRAARSLPAPIFPIESVDRRSLSRVPRNQRAFPLRRRKSISAACVVKSNGIIKRSDPSPRAVARLIPPRLNGLVPGNRRGEGVVAPFQRWSFTLAALFRNHCPPRLRARGNQVNRCERGTLFTRSRLRRDASSLPQVQSSPVQSTLLATPASSMSRAITYLRYERRFGRFVGSVCRLRASLQSARVLSRGGRVQGWE